MKKILMVLTLLFTANLHAFECNPEGSQAEMNRCALDDYEAADRKLNETWKALIAKYKKDQPYIKRIRAAQRAWIAFRDAEVAAMFACEDENLRFCWGSMYPMLYHGAMTDLTKQRTRRLQQYIDVDINPGFGER